MNNIKIRKVTLNDASAICNIYNYYIENTCITFETSPISESDMRIRINDIINSNMPYYVGEINEEIIGYYYLHSWNKRQAYSATLEVSIYIHKDYTEKGVGTLFYKHLFDHLDKEKIHVLIAGICIPNEKSVHLHEKFGFKQVSFMKEVGKKYGEWRDVGHWQLILE